MAGIAFLLLTFSFSPKAFGQITDEDRFALTFGLEFRRLANFSVFNLDSVVLIDPDFNFRGVYELRDGFGFGGVVRMRLTKMWNIESGLYFTRRRYDFRIQELQAPPFPNFSSETSFRVVAYEIPLKGLVYIQLGDALYMNVALGVAANFFASDVMAVGAERVYSIKAFKPSWIQLGVLGNVGFEYRTPENGYFYIGATWHQITNPIMRTEVNYFRPSDNSPGQFDPAGRQRGDLFGTYFSIDFRYFFKPEVVRKEKVNRVVPDWKNL